MSMEEIPRRPGFGGAIEAVRIIRGISQEELATKTGLNVTFLESYTENILDPINLDKIARALKIRASFIHLLADDNKNQLVIDLQKAVIMSIIKGVIEE